MAGTTSLRMNDRRERTFEYLQEATGENTTAGAIDVAANYYLAMAGDTGAHPTGALEELMERAVEQGSVTPREISLVLDSKHLSIEHSQEWNIGAGQE
jgi:hypothetical protein